MVRPELAVDFPDSPRQLSPRLLVFPMGWSWSLYFCQLAVEEVVVRCGWPRSRLVHDRSALPELDRAGLAAVYVDGVAVLSTDRGEADRQCGRVQAALDSVGLHCKPLEPAGGTQ
eukprot:11183641-Lingulodinium_polyedra.AAC.1